jgi:excinuclease ABC subunit A
VAPRRAPGPHERGPLSGLRGHAAPARGALRARPGAEHRGRYRRSPIADAAAFFRTLSLGPQETEIARPIVKEIEARLGFLLAVGLEYLSLDRAASTLSGGEGQRIRLATQIGSGLVGVLYILDEPSIGLHPRDTARLLETLVRLRDLGNTVVVVEHDRDTILAADHVIDMGPGAGCTAGTSVAEGPPAAIMANPDSLTGPVPRRNARGARSGAAPRRRPAGASASAGRAPTTCGSSTSTSRSGR